MLVSLPAHTLQSVGNAFAPASVIGSWFVFGFSLVPVTLASHSVGIFVLRFSDLGKVKRQEAYLSAVTRGYARDYEPLAAFFAEATTRRLEDAGR